MSRIQEGASPAGIVALAALWAVLACATYEARPLSLGEEAASVEARSLEDPALRAFVAERVGRPVPPGASWDLAMLVAAALYASPELRAARAADEVALAGIRTAGERRNPSLTVAGQYVTHLDPGTRPWVAGATLDVPLETAGKRGRRIEGATHRAEAAELGVREAAWRVRSRVRATLLDVLEAEDQLALLGRTAELRAEQVSLLEARLEAGAVAAPAVLETRLDLQRARLAVADARRTLGEARAALAAALGVPVEDLARVTLSFEAVAGAPAVPAPPAASMRRRALTGRADVRAALATYEARQADLALEIARQFPDVHLGPGYEWDQGEHKWGLALAYELPILSRNRGPIEAAAARREEAGAHLTALQVEVAGALDRAAAAYAGARATVDAADALADDAGRRLASARARLEAGATDRLGLLGAELEATAARLARRKAHADAQRALGALEDALEAPLSEGR